MAVLLHNPLTALICCMLVSCLPVCMLSQTGILSESIRQEEEGSRDEEIGKHVFETFSKHAFEKFSKHAPVCHELQARDVDFTLVTQVSISRIPIMKAQCERWGNHPMSVAVASHVAAPVVSKTLASLGCKNINLSVIITQPDEPYPINRLRNMALTNVQTSHAVYIDADFLVSPNLYDSLIAQRRELLGRKDAVVIPALELRSLCKDCRDLHLEVIPKTTQEALELYGETTEDAAVKQFDPKNPEGHATTRTDEWFRQQPNTLEPIKCIRSERYEPYLAFRYCRDLPPFQEAFAGYGQNKITWIKQLIREGYQFHRIANAFAIHFPHSQSKDSKQWKSKKLEVGKENLEVNKLSMEFSLWMNNTIPNQTVMPVCPSNEPITASIIR